MQRMKFALLVAALSLGASHAFSDGKPPDNAMTLSDLAKKLETQGFDPIVDMSYDDGQWEVEAYNVAGEKRDLKVDPVTGQVLSNELDD